MAWESYITPNGGIDGYGIGANAVKNVTGFQPVTNFSGTPYAAGRNAINTAFPNIIPNNIKFDNSGGGSNWFSKGMDYTVNGVGNFVTNAVSTGADILSSTPSVLKKAGKHLLGVQDARENVAMKAIASEYGFKVKDGKLVDKDGNDAVLPDGVTANGDGTYNIAGGWNAGQMLGNMQNILNLGNSGWGLYANVQNFKQNKELASKQKELLEQQIQSNKDNMTYLEKERKRQDTQRRNVAAQRTSESSIRNF